MNHSANNKLARHGRLPARSARTRLRVLPALLAMLAALVVAGLPGAAIAATGPPVGRPDLSVMDLAVGDLPPGAAVAAERYVREPGAVASYDRAFKFSGRAILRFGLVGVDGEVSLFGTTPDAFGTFSLLRLGLRNPTSRASIAHIYARQLHVRIKNVQVGTARDLHVADAGLALPVSVIKHRQRLTVVMAVMARDRVLGQLTVISTSRPRPAVRQTGRLLAAMSDHISAGLSPDSISPPLITGPTQVGAVVQADPGAWSDATKPTGIAYQWQRCDSTGNACVPIPGATQSSYPLTAADAGTTLRVSVTATNHAGATSAVSAPTPVIT